MRHLLVVTRVWDGCSQWNGVTEYE